MRPTHFYFKQFAVQHDRCSMKVGTDGVLLGAWTNIDKAIHLLDIGTGSGVIALMLAQRTHPLVTIDAVEIEREAALQAQQNVHCSPWPAKVKIHHTSIQDFKISHRYDLIISNPPYFNNSHQPPDKIRYQTRHTITLSFQALLASAKNFLKPQGRLNVILPFTEGIQFKELASQYNLHCSRQWSFRGRQEKPIERWLLEFRSDQELICEQGEIILFEKGDEWSDFYKSLTKDFYLRL